MMTTPCKPDGATGQTSTTKHVPSMDVFKQNLSESDFSLFATTLDEYEKAETIYAEQVNDLELKFRMKTLPMTQKRGAVLKQMPGFWAGALMNHKDIKPFVEDTRVQEFLRTYLADVELVYSFDPRFGEENVTKFGRDGIVIRAEFKNNPAFTNTNLTKAFGKKINEDDVEIGFCEGCTINWRSDKYKEEFLGQGAAEPTEEGDEDDANVDWFSFFGWWQLTHDELSDEHTVDEHGMDKFATAIINDLWSKPTEYYDMVDESDSDEDDESESEDEDESGSEDDML